MEKLQNVLDMVIAQAVIYGPKLFLALVTLFLGLSATKHITKFVAAILVRRNFDETLRPFLTNLVVITMAWLVFDGEMEASEFLGMQSRIYFSVKAQDWIIANAMITVLGVCACFYPAWKASRLLPVEALRSE